MLHAWNNWHSIYIPVGILSNLAIVVVQLISRVWLFATPCAAACQTSLFFTISRSLLKLMCIELMMPSNHLILCQPLVLLPSIFPSIRVFSNESALHIRWPKYWSFSSSISLSNEYSGLISFRIDWFDLLRVQGILKSLLQHHRWFNVYRRMCVGYMQILCHFIWRRKWQPTPLLLTENPMTEEPGGLQSMGSQRVGHDWVTSLHFMPFYIRNLSIWGFLYGEGRLWIPRVDSICFLN